jgi:glucan 1,3-beta-glucosidase
MYLRLLIQFKYASDKVIFFDHGTYLITSTLCIPSTARLVGECWSVLLGAGRVFEDQDEPQVVVKAGKEEDEGLIEISDLIFATRGPSACFFPGIRAGG